MPAYGLEADQQAREVYQQNTQKRMDGIDASRMTPAGGEGVLSDVGIDR